MNPGEPADHQPRSTDQTSSARPTSTIQQPIPTNPVSNPGTSVIQTMATPTTPSGSILGRPAKGVPGFTTTAPLDRSKGQAPTPAPVPVPATATAGQQDGETSARIVSALVPGGSTGSGMTQGQGLGEVNKSPYGNVNVNAGNGPASKWAWDSGYSTPAGETEAGKRKREGDTQTPGSQVLAGTPVSGVGAGAGHAGQPAGRDFDYSSDEMDDDMEDDEEDEDIEREPLPGENIFSRIRRDGSDVGNEDDVEEDGTAIIHVRRAAAAEEVDELESVNGGEQEHKVGQVKKIKLVLNNNGGKGKAGKMIIGPDGKPRKSDENRAVKRRKVVGDGASEGSVPPKDKGKAGLIDGELKVPGPRRSGGSRRADRPRRPPPLEMSSGNRELPPPSAGMMSSMRNTGMVSPVVSGFPLHQADKVTREAFRNSMAIKDAQRNLIQQRKDGAQPPPSDLPGGGPPPSAGPLPTLLTYIPTPSSGEGSGSFSDRRGDGVKHKVKSMKLNTGDMSSVRDGLRTAPSGKFGAQAGEEGIRSEDDEEYEAREAAGYDADGNSFYEMEKTQRAQDANPNAPADGSTGGKGPRTAHPSLGASLQAQQTGKGPSNRGLPSSLHIPPYGQRTRSQQHLGPPSGPDGAPPDTAGGRPGPGMMPPGYYPYPPLPPGHPFAGAQGRGMAGPPPPGFHPGQYDRERDAFMSHFAKFYDALLDSTQLRADLATKIHKANELVGAHQIELRKVENLRQQYEAALADLKTRTDKALSPSEPKTTERRPSKPRSSVGPPAGDVEMKSS